ncbi:hypothetical protein L6452_09208 [Arctium lappa]|uniref:Uncharacterized protein n=1 Tax=Arctium lappa TaxID=4217 RepID=A0ACB9DJC5_ARCLA|nr:hypothetical protein L6452_09208 [Arctium lappa]
MAKKRKARSSQATAEQLPVEDQTADDAAVAEEQEQGDEQLQNLEENKENDEQGDEGLDEDDDDEEEEEDEEDEEEENEEETTGNEAKEVKVETNGGGGQETECLAEDPVDKLLEPFSKEQLVLLLKEAVSKYPDFIQSVEKIADADPAHRKIFVHGLGWDTNTETLISEYGRYGEIEDCKAVVDKVSGKSKGYGFILFKHRSGARKALKEPQKKIGNRITSCQLASAGPVPAPPPTAPPVSEYTQRKIFVSNVSAEIDPQKLLDFFSKFGEIEEGPLGLDKQTGKPKGFALFVYKSIESAKQALEEPHKNFEGHTLHCQKAIDGPKPGKGFYQQQHQHPHQHQQYGGHHHHPSKKAKYSGAGGGAGQGIDCTACYSRSWTGNY